MRKKQKKLLIVGGGVILLVAVIAANIAILKKQFNNLPFFRTPTPTPFKYSKYAIPAPLPSGKQVYNVSRGSGSKGPAIERVTIDPFDPIKGQSQIYSIKISNNTPVTKVLLTITTDYQTTPYEATLKEGKSTDGVWEAIVPATDTHDYVYRVVVEVADAKDKFAVTLTVR